jgi:hypothetical protein
MKILLRIFVPIVIIVSFFISALIYVTLVIPIIYYLFTGKMCMWGEDIFFGTLETLKII